MAIIVGVPQDIKYGIFEQAAWGTVAPDDSDATELNVEHITVDRDVKLREFNHAHANRNPIYTDKGHDGQYAQPKFTVKGPYTKAVCDYFLFGCFQSVTEADTTPFGKTFVYHATQPDFSVDAGFFFTLFQQFPTAGTTWKVKDCIVQKLTLTLDRAGQLMFSADCVGNGIPIVTSTPTGTWVAPSINLRSFGNVGVATADFGGGVVNLVLDSFELTFGHGEIRPVGTDGSGGGQTSGLTGRGGTFSITTLWDANTQTGLTNHSGDTGISFNLGWGHATPGTDDDDLDILFTSKLNNVEPVFDPVLGSKLTGDILATTGATEPATIIMANAIDRGW